MCVPVFCGLELKITGVILYTHSQTYIHIFKFYYHDNELYCIFIKYTVVINVLLFRKTIDFLNILNSLITPLLKNNL